MMDSGIEIIFDSIPSRKAVLRGVVGVLLVLGIFVPAWIGRGYSPKTDTPSGVRVLTWQDWQANKLQTSYNRELAGLRNDWDALNAILAQPPDPIAAGLLHDRIAARRQFGIITLSNHRAALLSANDAVYDWATAANTFEFAAGAMQTALDILGAQP